MNANENNAVGISESTNTVENPEIITNNALKKRQIKTKMPNIFCFLLS